MQRIRFVLLLSLVLLPCAGKAQESTAVAPMPSPLVAGKKVFLSNAGADAGLFPHPFSGDTARAYNYLYKALLVDGKYKLVRDPGQADLVFEIRLTAPNGPSSGDKSKGASDPLPMVRLVVYDRLTHYVLWAVTESVEAANLQKTHDRNFDTALDEILTDLKAVFTSKH
jgi:hypothetical protein